LVFAPWNVETNILGDGSVLLIPMLMDESQEFVRVLEID